MRFAASEYILTALAIGWNLSAGHLFPVEELNGEWGTVALTAPRMTAALQAHLREGGDVRPVHVALVSGGWIASQVNRGHGGGRYHEDRGLEERSRSTILPLVLQLKPLRESATVATRQRFDLPLVHGLSGGKIENGTESDIDQRWLHGFEIRYARKWGGNRPSEALLPSTDQGREKKGGDR